MHHVQISKINEEKVKLVDGKETKEENYIYWGAGFICTKIV